MQLTLGKLHSDNGHFIFLAIMGFIILDALHYFMESQVKCALFFPTFNLFTRQKKSATKAVIDGFLLLDLHSFLL